MYTLLALLVLLAALTWHQLLKRPARWAWLVLWSSELLVLYAHNTGPVVALWLNAVTLLAWAAQRSLKRPDWRVWIAGQVAVGLLWLPYLLTRFAALQSANSALISRPEISPELLGQIWQAFWTGPWALVGQELVIIIAAGAAFMLWLGLIPWRQAGARWLVLHAALLVAGLVAGLSILGNELHGRYLVMIAPLLLVPLGAGMARLPSAGLRGLIAFGFGGLLLANIYYAQQPQYQHDDARGMVAYYAETLTADDTVLAWSYADRYDLWYYWDRLGVQARRVTLPEGADLEAVAPLLPQSGDVALNVWYTQRADYRGMMNCLLSAGTTGLPVEHEVYGMSSLLYESPLLRLPALQLLDGQVLHDGVEVAALVSAGALPQTQAHQAVCLPITLTLRQPVTDDLKAAVVVYNALGWELARADAIFATANQRTTSVLNIDETASAYALLRLPYGAPPGEYAVALRVYDEQGRVEGYDLRGVNDAISRELPLATWTATPADWTDVPRDTALPHEVNFAVNDRLTLLAHDLPQAQRFNTGEKVRLSLLWAGQDALPELTLSTADNAWQITIPADGQQVESVLLDWRELQIPLDAPAGLAEVRLPDGTALALGEIVSLPMLLEAPYYDMRVNVEISGIGALTGFSTAASPIDRTQPLEVTLIWRAGDMPIDVSYTVFVQLLNAEGGLIAQSDALPAQGSRPTTGWRAGEYIADMHTLMFNSAAAPGEAYLIVGLYDQRTNQRVQIGEADFIRLPGIIEVR